MSRLVDADALRDRIEDHVTTVSACCTSQEAYGRTRMKMLALRDVDEAPTVDAIPVEWFIRMNLSCGMQGEIGAVAALNWVLEQWKMTKEEWDNGLEVKNESCGRWEKKQADVK